MSDHEPAVDLAYRSCVQCQHPRWVHAHGEHCDAVGCRCDQFAVRPADDTPAGDLDEAERLLREWACVDRIVMGPSGPTTAAARVLAEYDRRAQEIEQVTYERDEALARVAAAKAVQGRMADSLPADGPWELWGHRDRAVREYEGELSAALAVEVDPLADRRVETERLRAVADAARALEPWMVQGSGPKWRALSAALAALDGQETRHA